MGRRRVPAPSESPDDPLRRERTLSLGRRWSGRDKSANLQRLSAGCRLIEKLAIFAATIARCDAVKCLLTASLAAPCTLCDAVLFLRR